MTHKDVHDLLRQFILSSKDAYAIFNEHDEVIFCNQAFEDFMSFTFQTDPYFTFNDLVRHAFELKRGIAIDMEDIDAWLEYANSQRRQRDFRIFEVDMVDGRWMLVSEQLLPSGELLLQAKNITRQKVLESQLQSSVSTLRNLALTDELTQLANRRSFRASVEQEQDRYRADKEQINVALIIIDLDNFKRVNDKYSHLAGDKVLKELSLRMKSTLRAHDMIGRLGGEEFAVFLGNIDEPGVMHIAKRLKDVISDTPVDYEGQQIHVTGSLGVDIDSADSTFEKLYAAADAALYCAKAAGRNRIKFSAK